MAHKITDDCTLCGACADVCPSDAISEGDEQYEIDAEKCDDCVECVEECPAESIVPA